MSGVTEGSSQMNTCPAAQMSLGPLGGVWIGWECRKDVVGPWWKCGSSLIHMYLIVVRDRLRLILWHVVMPPIARGPTSLCQPLPVPTGPNTGRNLSNSKYRGIDGDHIIQTQTFLCSTGVKRRSINECSLPVMRVYGWCYGTSVNSHLVIRHPILH